MAGCEANAAGWEANVAGGSGVCGGMGVCGTPPGWPANIACPRKNGVNHAPTAGLARTSGAGVLQAGRAGVLQAMDVANRV